MECRSAVNSTLAGNRPLPSLPSDSPYSCFHHSAMNRKQGSYAARISIFLPVRYISYRAPAYCHAGLASISAAVQMSIISRAPAISASMSMPAAVLNAISFESTGW